MKRVAAVLAVFLSASLAAQGPSAGGAVDQASAALDEGKFLKASDMLAAAAFDRNGKVKDDFAFQIWRQVSPMVTGELDRATLDRAQPLRSADPGMLKRIARSTSRDAIAEIVRRARDTSIVILNEAHDSPRDRAFALQVARALRPLGYSVLAAEAFDNERAHGSRLTAIEQLRRDGFVRIGTGFYTRDPVYAAFVRGALKAGYRPVAYEQTSDQTPPDNGHEGHGGIGPREQAQAENLAAIHIRSPSAKMLIYVGYSHVAEAAVDLDAGKMEWMAVRLKRLTGIDPLTIDQASLTDVSADLRSVHDRAAARVGSRPSVLFDSNRPLMLGSYAGAVDLEVVHPRRAFRYGRPSWLALLGGTPRSVPAHLLPATGRRLVQVFAASAPRDAIPLDQLLVRAGTRPGKLMVPPGPVRYAVQP